MKKDARPRGRPRSFDETDVLDIAKDLFWQRGYEATSIKDLTEAMGMTPPSLYAAFGSKEALYRRVLDRYIETFGHRLREGLFEEPDLRKAVSRIVHIWAPPPGPDSHVDVAMRKLKARHVELRWTMDSNDGATILPTQLTSRSGRGCRGEITV